MTPQKLLKQPAKILLIALVATSSAAIPLRAVTPRVARLMTHENNNNGATSIIRTKARAEIYIPEGVQRWGLNE